MARLKATPVCQLNVTCKGWNLGPGIWFLFDDDDEDYSDAVCQLCEVDVEVKWFFRVIHLVAM